MSSGADPIRCIPIRNVHAPVDRGTLPKNGLIQFRAPLAEDARRLLAAHLAESPELRLRVYGAALSRDQLAPFACIRTLELHLQCFDPRILGAVPQLEALCVRARATDVPIDAGLALLPHLQRLELAGDAAAVTGPLPPLQTLALEGAPLLTAATLANPQALRVLRLHETPIEPALFTRLRALQRLELRRVRGFVDLRPLLALDRLEELRLVGMGHLNFADFRPLEGRMPAACSLDLESRGKEREVYRLLGAGRLPS